MFDDLLLEGTAQLLIALAADAEELDLFALADQRQRAFEDGLLSLLRGKNVEILNSIRESRDLSDDTAGKLKAVVESFSKTLA